MSEVRVVVVGAGIAGLTAALYLEAAGQHVIVLEASGRVGGRMVSDSVDGFTIDEGAQFLSTRYPVLGELIERVGFAASIVEVNPWVAVVRGGRLRRIRPDAPLSPLRSGLLRLPAYLRLAVGGMRLGRRTRALSQNDLSAWTSYDETDGKTWSESYFGAEVTRFMIEPCIASLFFQRLHDDSAALAMHTTSLFYGLSGDVKLTAPVGGMGALTRQLASGLDVRLGSRVGSISVAPTGVELTVGAERISANHVILAAPASAARVLHPEPTATERELLATPYSTTATVAIMVRRSFRLGPDVSNLYAFNLPESDRGAVVAVTIEEAKGGGRVGNGHLFHAYLSGDTAPKMIASSDDQIVSVVLSELEKYLPGVSREVFATRVYRWKEALALTPPGRARLVAQYRKSIGPAPRFLLAGDYTGMPFTEGAAETGRWAATTLVDRLAQWGGGVGSVAAAS
ncbi:NAD(P)/FAD-dependent oxidoreductase [Gryllotalpicola sp.]|uniref:protoporphyrinogen/coproporphyrinogen oxidase n=1 Tax=Gryllotalpicola sp. TaxID=1932787 RepID=UPI00262C9941|nr:NAD(P)/FAD-dependent oxidoreductase [Gryllotalpicola sp.]